jgi:hypothetical protein
MRSLGWRYIALFSECTCGPGCAFLLPVTDKFLPDEEDAGGRDNKQNHGYNKPSGNTRNSLGFGDRVRISGGRIAAG